MEDRINCFPHYFSTQEHPKQFFVFRATPPPPFENVYSLEEVDSREEGSVTAELFSSNFICKELLYT